MSIHLSDLASDTHVALGTHRTHLDTISGLRLPLSSHISTLRMEEGREERIRSHDATGETISVHGGNEKGRENSRGGERICNSSAGVAVSDVRQCRRYR